MAMKFGSDHEEGASLVECALAVALIALIAVPAVNMVGGSVRCALLEADANPTARSPGDDAVWVDDECLSSAVVVIP